MKVYKLLNLRKDGTLGSLFIDRKKVIEEKKWLVAKNIPTKGYKVRPGWHSTSKPEAPHLSKKGRVWCEISIKNFYKIERPKNQGGVWYISKYMKVNKILNI